MKKLLVVLMAAMMVFSMAAASMAAATVSGDWRWEWVNDETSDEDEYDYGNDRWEYSESDLRFNFDGKVSDSVSAYMQIAIEEGEFLLKEYKVIFKQSFGTITAGMWDYKLAPSRVLLKAHQGLDCLNAYEMQILIEIPFADNFTFGLFFTPALKNYDGDYWGVGDYQDAFDLKLAYNTERFGIEGHYGKFTSWQGEDFDNDYLALDFYYNITKDIKATLVAVNSDEDNVISWAFDEDGDYTATDAIIGLIWKNIAGSKLTGAVEYDLMDNDAGENQLAFQFKYAFTNKVNLEVEIFENYKDYDTSYYVIRPRVKF